MVRETKTLDEPFERTCGTAMSPEELRARGSFVDGKPDPITKPDAARDIIARVDADFERIFGSE